MVGSSPSMTAEGDHDDKETAPMPAVATSPRAVATLDQNESSDPPPPPPESQLPPLSPLSPLLSVQDASCAGC